MEHATFVNFRKELFFKRTKIFLELEICYRPIGEVILPLNEPYGHTFLALHLDALPNKFASPVNRKPAETQNVE